MKMYYRRHITKAPKMHHKKQPIVTLDI